MKTKKKKQQFAALTVNDAKTVLASLRVIRNHVTALAALFATLGLESVMRELPRRRSKK